MNQIVEIMNRGYSIEFFKRGDLYSIDCFNGKLHASIAIEDSSDKYFEVALNACFNEVERQCADVDPNN